MSVNKFLPHVYVIPEDRVFVVGAKETPERLKQAVGGTFEDIGLLVAEDCYKGTVEVWGHNHLMHNEPDRLRLVQAVTSILFATQGHASP